MFALILSESNGKYPAGHYVATPRSERSYVGEVSGAHLFPTVEAAERSRCQNEVVVEVAYVSEERPQLNFNPGDICPADGHYTLHRGRMQVMLYEPDPGGKATLYSLKLRYEKGKGFPPGPYPGFYWKREGT